MTGVDDYMNTEKIMQEIREDIRANNYIDDTVSFDHMNHLSNLQLCSNDEEYLTALERLSQNWNVNWCHDFPRKGVKGMLKKVIRHTVAFLIVPMADEQNLFNADVAKAIIQMASTEEKYERRIQILENQLRQLRETQQILER